MKIDFAKSGEKKEILKEIKGKYSIPALPYLLLRLGKDRIYGFSGHLSREEILEISNLANIEMLGLYLINIADYRLGFDATQVLKNKIGSHILDINDEQLKKWMAGEDLEIKSEKGIFVVRHENDFLGCAKSTGERILNHVPKERRIKKF